MQQKDKMERNANLDEGDGFMLHVPAVSTMELDDKGPSPGTSVIFECVNCALEHP